MAGNEEVYEGLKAFSKLIQGKIFREKEIKIKVCDPNATKTVTISATISPTTNIRTVDFKTEKIFSSPTQKRNMHC